MSGSTLMAWLIVATTPALARSPIPPPEPTVGPAVWEVDGPRLACGEHVETWSCQRAFEIGPGGQITELAHQGGNLGLIRVSPDHVFIETRITFSTVLVFERSSERAGPLDWPGGRVRAMQPLGQDLVVIFEDSIYALPVDGRDRRLLVRTPEAWTLATFPRQVVWTRDGGQDAGGVWTMEDGDAQRRVAVGADHPSSVAVDKDGIAWADFRSDARPGTASGSIRLAPRVGEPVTLATNQWFPQRVSTDATHVYWVGTVTDQGRYVRRVAKEGGPVEDLATSPGRATRKNKERLMVEGGFVYWNAGHSVMRVGVTGGEPTVLISVPQDGDIIDFDVQDARVWVTAWLPNRNRG